MVSDLMSQKLEIVEAIGLKVDSKELTERSRLELRFNSDHSVVAVM